MQHTQLPIEQGVLRDVMRQATGNHTAMLGAWQVEPTAYHNVSAASRGLYRVRGMAHSGDVIEPWSVVLKTFAAPTDAATSDWATLLYWRCEGLAYRSGLLADLRGPRCNHRTQGQVYPSLRRWRYCALSICARCK